MRDYVKTFCAGGSSLSMAGPSLRLSVPLPRVKTPSSCQSFVKSYKYILRCCDCRNANLDRAETTI